MVKKHLIFLSFVLFFINHQLAAQSDQKNDSLAEGVFYTRVEFLKQKPHYTPEQLYRPSGTAHFSIRSWSNRDSLYVMNGKARQTIKRDEVWGFYDDGNLFIQLNGFFHKAAFIGNITLFNEVYPVMNAPFNPVATETTKDITPRIMNMPDGKILSYSPNSLMELLQTDKTLSNNYKALSKKLRKKMMYSFIERFNNRHPLFDNR